MIGAFNEEIPMLATVTAWIVVALHLLFGLMESAGWSQMARRFGYNKEKTEITRSLALNQGAFIAMLAYVVAMAVVGAVSVRWTIFVIQGVPAVIALAAALLS
jgi:uncharacterized membrane protein